MERTTETFVLSQMLDSFHCAQMPDAFTHFPVSQQSKRCPFFASYGCFSPLRSQNVLVFAQSQSLPACFDSGPSVSSWCL